MVDLPDSSPENLDVPLTRRRTRLRRMVRWLRGRIRHPRRVDCLDCGFLALGGEEVHDAARIEIATPSSGSQPDWKRLWCHCNRWLDYDLMYVGPSYEALQDELQSDRRLCDSFLRYRHGWSPDEHRDLVLKKEELRVRVVLLLLGSVLGFVLGLLAP